MKFAPSPSPQAHSAMVSPPVITQCLRVIVRPPAGRNLQQRIDKEDDEEPTAP